MLFLRRICFCFIQVRIDYTMAHSLPSNFVKLSYEDVEAQVERTRPLALRH